MFLQDHARAFAGSQSDEHKYELYMKATGFEAIMQRQNASEAHIQQVKEHLNGWSDRLEVGAAPTQHKPFCVGLLDPRVSA